MDIFYIIKIIFVYILSIFLGIVVSWIIYPLLYRFLPIGIIKKYKKILHFFLAIFTMISTFLEVVVIIYVFKFFNISNSFFAIILYTLLLLNNDIRRITNIKKDKSPVKSLMVLNQEESSYDKAMDLKKEYFCLIGGLIGLLSALFLI